MSKKKEIKRLNEIVESQRAEIASLNRSYNELEEENRKVRVDGRLHIFPDHHNSNELSVKDNTTGYVYAISSIRDMVKSEEVNSKLKSIIAQLTSENSKLKSENERVKIQNSNLVEENETLNTQLEKVEKENELLTMQSRTVGRYKESVELERLKLKVRRIETENQKLHNLKNTIQAAKTKVEVENRKLKTDMEILNNIFDSIQKELDSKESGIFIKDMERNTEAEKELAEKHSLTFTVYKVK